MLELALATLVLSAISDQESDAVSTAPHTGAVPSSSLLAHRVRSLHASDHLIGVQEDRANDEVRRLQRLIKAHALRVQRVREEREGLRERHFPLRQR